MNPSIVEEVAKILKSIIVAAGLLGVNISPENQAAIIEIGSALVTVVYSMEAIAKRQKRKENDKPAETVSVAE